MTESDLVTWPKIFVETCKMTKNDLRLFFSCLQFWFFFGHLTCFDKKFWSCYQVRFGHLFSVKSKILLYNTLTKTLASSLRKLASLCRLFSRIFRRIVSSRRSTFPKTSLSTIMVVYFWPSCNKQNFIYFFLADRNLSLGWVRAQSDSTEI